MNKLDLPDLVTGGCGFVGRHLVKKLLEKGKSVWILDNLSTGQLPEKWLKYVEAHTDSHKTVYKISAEQEVVFINIDVINFFMEQMAGTAATEIPSFGDVYHLASIVGGRTLIDGDPILVATDFGIDALFFVWATRNRAKCKRILYASSSAAYPVHLQNNVENQPSIALKEDMITFDKIVGKPDMTYGWGKLSGEYLARLAAKQYQMHVACIRPFSGYGEDQDVSYPVPAIARRIVARQNPIEVWGTGKQGRDFVYIDDCIDAMGFILDNVQDGSGVNVGTGRLTSFLELIGVYCEIEGYSPQIKPLTDKPVGVQSRYADASLINSFGWTPATSLHNGLSKVLQFAREGSASLI